MLMNKKYAIFDMDGTLVDSMPWWQGLAEEYLYRMEGISDVSREILEEIRPMTIQEAAVYFKKKYQINKEPETIAAQVNELMAEHYRKDILLKPGTGRFLEKLKKQNVRMCVASATAEYLMEACLDRLGVRDKFEFLLSCEAVGAGKHRPDVYHLAAGRLEADIKDTVVYEDALHAVRTAKKAGFYVVAVYDESMRQNWESICKYADEAVMSWEETE